MKQQCNRHTLLFLLLGVFLASCNRNGNAQSHSVNHSPSTDLLIGTLIQNQPGDIWAPSQYCLEGEGKLYQGFDYRLGETNVSLPVSAPNTTLYEATLVELSGYYEKDLTRKITHIGSCDPDTFVKHIQMRGDWGNPESGSMQGLTTRKRLEELSWFEVNKATESKFLTFQPHYEGKTPQSLTLTFTNVFQDALPELEITLHYEGGPGKPMPKYENRPIPPLQPGKTFSVEVPVIHTSEADSSRKYAFSSVMLQQTDIQVGSQKITFEIDLPFYKLGISDGFPSHKSLR